MNATDDRRRSALARCVGDVERFAANRWGAKPLLLRQADRFDDLLTIEDVDALIASAPRRPEIRLVHGGERVDGWSGTVRLGGRQVDDVADAGAVARQFADGATVVLQSLHRTWTPLRRFVERLEHEISHPVQANAYLTPPGSAGLSRHSDGHDVIVVQLHGVKHWSIDGIGEIDLAAGDTLYLPAGTEHDASTSDRSSLHLTIGIIPITRRDVLARMLKGDDESLDVPLPLGYANATEHDELAAHVAAARDAGLRLLQSTAPEDVARTEQGRRRPRLRHDGRLASIAQLDALGPDSMVALRTGPAPTITTDADQVHVDLGRQSVRLPIGGRSAIEQLCSGTRVRVGDLRDLDETSQLVVVRRLILEGLIVVEAL